MYLLWYFSLTPLPTTTPLNATSTTSTFPSSSHCFDVPLTLSRTYQIAKFTETNFRVPSVAGVGCEAAHLVWHRHQHPFGHQIHDARTFDGPCLALQPMQHHARAYVSQLPPACLVQVQVPESGAVLLSHSRCTRPFSATQREAVVWASMGLHSNHHPCAHVVCGVQVNAPVLSSMWAEPDNVCCTARAYSTARPESWPRSVQNHAS